MPGVREEEGCEAEEDGMKGVVKLVAGKMLGVAERFRKECPQCGGYGQYADDVTCTLCEGVGRVSEKKCEEWYSDDDEG